MQYVNRYLKLTVRAANNTTKIYDVSWKIVFSIRKSASSNYLSFNQAEISIYNLNTDEQNWIAQTGTTITLDAGYQDLHANIFDGVVNNITHSKNGVDVVTTLYCSSTVRNYAVNAGVSVQNMTVTDLLKSICEKNSISYVLPFNKSDIVAKSYSGTVAKVIAMICTDYSISAGIDNGVLIFKDKDKTTDDIKDQEIRTFTPTSGVLGSPALTEYGISFQTLMNPKLQVNDYFNLKAPYINYNLNNLNVRPNAVTGSVVNAMAHTNVHNYNGLYMALSLSFQGDTRGNAWYTNIEGSRVWSREQLKRAKSS